MILVTIGLARCGHRGMRPCMPELAAPELEKVVTEDIVGRYNIDSTQTNSLSLLVEKLDALETYWSYMFMPFDANYFNEEYGSLRIFNVRISEEQIKKLRSSVDSVLQHWDRQDKGFEFTYPPPDEEPLDSAVYMAFNKSGSGYRGMLRLEKENYRWVGDSLASTYSFEEKEEVRKFRNLLDKGLQRKDDWANSADSQKSNTLSGGC